MNNLMLICGEGEEVNKTLDSLRRKGFDPIIVGIKGLHSLKTIDERVHGDVPIGKIGKVKQIADENGVNDIAFVGRFSSIVMDDIDIDEAGLNYLLRNISNPGSLQEWRQFGESFFIDEGYNIVDVSSKVDSISNLPTGFATEKGWSDENQQDFFKARRIQVSLNFFGIGDVVVVRRGSIMGIRVENEGTDDVLERLSHFELGNPNGVIVKWPFSDKNGNIVLSPTPAVGLQTFRNIHKANLAGAVIHRTTRVWNAKEVVEFCDRNELFLLVKDDGE